jgi:transcriptional regulator with XRE-family HTH domain
MSRHTKETKKIDLIVGQKINEKRLAMGLSRQQLADKIGVTHQQVQKYEKGTDRVSFGRMVLIARALNEPLKYFTEVDNENKLATNHQRMQIEVSRNFAKIENPANQNAVNILIKTLAKEG